MQPSVGLEGILRGPSNQALDLARSLADSVGGFVIQASWLSNLVLSAHVDMLAGDVVELAENARAAGVEVDEDTLARARSRAAGFDDEADLTCVLVLHCVHGEPEARRVVPAVPG